jgi:hypothetical protein
MDTLIERLEVKLRKLHLEITIRCFTKGDSPMVKIKCYKSGNPHEEFCVKGNSLTDAIDKCYNELCRPIYGASL